MLTVLSDLHFCDGTATEKNVSPGAFALALRDVYALAEEMADKRNRPTTLHLVLLGDIVDLLRTERWFEDANGQEVPLSERPWGSAEALEGKPAPEAVLKRARAIFEEVARENQEALRTLRGELHRPPAGVEVKRIYLPGNHDRLYLHDPALARRVREELGAVETSSLADQGVFETHLAMPDYGLLARHGHEWDPWNFGGYREGTPASAYVRADHLATSIGDPVTTELAARLPYELRKRLADSRVLTDEEKDHVYRRMQRIEDVRPVLASLQWAYFEADCIGGALDAQKSAEVTRAVDATVKDLARQFLALDFYKAWRAQKNKRFRIDPTDLLHTALVGLTKVDLDHVMRLAGVFESLGAHAESKDTCRVGAAKEDLKALGDKHLRCVVYGHTHLPLEAALHAGGGVSDVYLNSGTFRQGVFRTEDRKGFVGWERMTYLSFFSREEAELGPPRPGFESWTGARRR